VSSSSSSSFTFRFESPRGSFSALFGAVESTDARRSQRRCLKGRLLCNDKTIVSLPPNLIASFLLAFVGRPARQACSYSLVCFAKFSRWPVHVGVRCFGTRIALSCAPSVASVSFAILPLLVQHPALPFGVLFASGRRCLPSPTKPFNATSGSKQLKELVQHLTACRFRFGLFTLFNLGHFIEPSFRSRVASSLHCRPSLFVRQALAGVKQCVFLWLRSCAMLAFVGDWTGLNRTCTCILSAKRIVHRLFTQKCARARSLSAGLL